MNKDKDDLIVGLVLIAIGLIAAICGLVAATVKFLAFWKYLMS